MTTEPRTDTDAAAIDGQTARVLRDFVREAVARLSIALGDSAPAFDDEARFERGGDGHFRLHKQRIWAFWSALRGEWFHSLPGYQKCIECLKSDVVVGPHLDRLVGTTWSASRVEAGNIVASLISTMRDDEGRPAFLCEKFHSEWEEWVKFFVTKRIASKMVAPLPNLVVPAFPLRLNTDLVLDQLTDDEVTRCYQTGVIRPNILRFPIIYAETAVGIRRTSLLPKVLRQDNDTTEPPGADDEGSFGRRPYFRDD